MEIGHERIDGAKLESRVDEQVGFAAPVFERRRKPAALGRGFQDARGGRSHRHHAAAFAFRVRDYTKRRTVDLERFRREAIRFDGFVLERLKRSWADVEQEGSNVDALGAEAREKRIVEMESGGWCRHRTTFARIHRLITVAIGRRIVATNVRRQRDVTESIEEIIDGRFKGLEASFSFAGARKEAYRCIAGTQHFTRPELSHRARPREERVRIQRTHHEYFHIETVVAPHDQSRRHDARAIEYQHITGAQKLG